ncbi:MAG TPA: hypothetical protein O0Y13_00830, partial [Methanocorpusculum sp.]|nr:hypothetical protein [Methanocorpusculum sp.]
IDQGHNHSCNKRHQHNCDENLVTQLKEYLLQLGNEVFIAIVLMSLVTTVIVPLVYRGWFFKAEKKPDPAVGIQQ